MRNQTLFGIISIAVVSFAGIIHAAPVNQLVKVLASDGAADDQFGNAVAIFGTTAVVGVAFDDDLGVNSGSAYLVDTTDGQFTKLFASDGAAGDNFGISIAISGTTVIIGAEGNGESGSDSGAAYVFDSVSGQQLFKVLAGDGSAGDNFGRSVAISGTIAVVGSPHGGENGNGSGAAYVFDSTTGQQLFKLLPVDGAADDRFGSSVSISGIFAIVGSPEDDDNGSKSGSAYVFDVSTGQQIAKLVHSDGLSNDLFGSSVGIDGSTAVVGAHHKSDNGTWSGAAYLFDVTTGQELFKLMRDDFINALDQFGVSVSIHGATTVIGARKGSVDDFSGINSGTAFLFDTSTGLQVAEIVPDDVQAVDQFGIAVANYGTSLFVGSNFDDDNGNASGSAYLFDIGGKRAPCAGDQLMKVLPSDGGSYQYFGSSVAVSGSVAIVGSSTLIFGAAHLFDSETGLTLARLTPDGGIVSTDDFGIAVAIDGAIAMVGASSQDAGEIRTGAAYLFDAATGQQLFNLTAADGSTNDQFGAAVALDGTVAIVGAWGDDDDGENSGSAYLFDTGTGQQLHKLVANDGAQADRFGVSVAISGTNAIVGSYWDDDNGEKSGAAYLFDTVSGQQLFKLVPDDNAATDWFGNSVAISGNIAVIGALLDDDFADKSGSVYVFDVKTGDQILKLLPDVSIEDDLFGTTVSISGDTILVGSTNHNEGAGIVYVFDANSGQQLSMLVASDSEELDSFGGAISVDGATILVGARNNDDNGANSGSSYLFTTTGQEVMKILPTTGASGDRFGGSVAISGTSAVIGAKQFDAHGVAFVIHTATGGQLFELRADEGVFGGPGLAGDDFGASVSISGSMTLVGADGRGDNGSGSGAAYLFDNSTGQQEFKFLAGDGAAGDSLGSAVAIGANTAIVGAPGDDDNGAESGAVYFFDTTTGLELIKALSDDGAPGDAFGAALAASGTTMIVGAPGDDDNGIDSGSAYVYDIVSGSMLLKLLPDDGSADDSFGSSVSISGTIAIVGAAGHDENGNNSGAAYVFDITTGQQLFRLMAADGASLDAFGCSVAISGVTAVIGADLDDDNGSNSGSAYIFDVTTGQQIVKALTQDGALADFAGTSVAIDGATVIIGAIGDDDHGSFSGSSYVFEAVGFYSVCPVDFNGDGVVDTADLGVLLSQFGTAGPESDVNCDGGVDTADLGVLLGLFGTDCP